MQDLRSCEKFETCIHEAGHLFVLRYFGGDGYIEIFDNPTKTKYDKDTLGRVVCTKQPTKENQIRRTNILVGLAGHCAELMNFDPDSEWLANDLEDFWDYDYEAISNTDRTLTENVSFDDFEDCATLIQANYPEILAIAKAKYIKAGGVL